ncbi:chorismate synthase [bacterium BMS3Bbin06]|nr:chorismate synthase [bacterium BMS3Abin08]GBE34095.1 chorismate synthase [bacterium BMS3Bbin06]HDO36237.1 chorismate synthase [Nitrospirota bacterium]HDY70512.1 chorismate synthase [Nitrospirota bacterium]
MLKLLQITAGESHGKGLVAVIEGIPANMEISPGHINTQLKRRQAGYGRGGRMKIEYDEVEIISGIRWGKTLGSPIALMIKNRDWSNWEKGMSISVDDSGSIPPVTRPRPGHADLPGTQKFHHDDIRNILERSSARETAARVAIGAVARRFLEELGITIGSFVTSIGHASYGIRPSELEHDELLSLSGSADSSDVRCPSEETAGLMREAVDQAKEGGYSLGGTFITFALGVPPGIGSHTLWQRRLDARLSYAFMGIQAIKGVEVGDGFEMASRPGHEVLDEIFPPAEKGSLLYTRKTNHAGGIEGGISNGMPLIVRAAMKPIPTQQRPLGSVDLRTGEEVKAAYERSDVCAVPAASVIGEAMMALVTADAFLEKFGGDSMEETTRNYQGYMKSLT